MELDKLSIKEIKFTASDGFVLQGKLYSNVKTDRYLLIGSAFGVPNSYYRHFAQFLALQGINVLSFDYRGIESSQQGVVTIQNMRLNDWAEKDLEAAVKFLSQKEEAKHIYYLGHSFGGQVVGLIPSSKQFKKIILTATGIGHWSLWPGLYKVGMFLVWKLLFPIAMFFRRKPLFNSYLLGKVPIPRNLVNDWLNWARSEKYLFTPTHGLDLSGYAEIRQPLLPVSITDDRYAPIKAFQALLKEYPNAEFAQALRINPKSIGLNQIGHFGLFKKKQEIEQALWQPMFNFLNGKSDE